jgi:hypothetical protein
MASSAEKYNIDLKLFNIDLYYEDNYIKADLIYPSNYATVNFYHTQVGTTYSIGNEYKTFERLIGIKETLTSELNYNYSENFKDNIVFTDIDEFGIKITINSMVYQEEVAYVYNGINIDMDRTIDRTLRNWLTRSYLDLAKLGIDVELRYTGSYASLFYNSILIQTKYPNVPIIVNNIEVGSTANYYIEHSTVLFNELGYYLNLNINGDDYGVQTITTLSPTYSIADIPATLESWVSLHSGNLLLYGILVESVNNLLKFDVKTTSNALRYTITNGKSSIPGLGDYRITKKLKGNEGVLIASNEVILGASSSSSFEEVGFATGMVFSINNTYYPFVNQEFNIQYLDPKVLNLSYQGPFWDVNRNICNVSPFVTIAFNLGFGQTACAGIGLTGSKSGQFDIQQFSTDQFNIKFNPNTYTLDGYDVGPNMIDIKYIQLSNSIFTLGDNLDVIDSYFGNYITTINLLGNTQSIKMEFNPINNYIYCLSNTKLYVIDPLINSLLSVISLNYDAFDLSINNVNGDIYISYATASVLSIYNYNNTPYADLTGYVFGKMVFNDYESDIYITTDSTSVLRIDGSNRTIQETYTVPGLIPSIFYEPVNENIYVYATSSLWIIGTTSSQTSLSTNSTEFTDIILNNLTGELNISDSSSNFTKLNLDGTIVSQSNPANYGYLALSPYDGGVYLSSLSSNTILVLDGINGNVLFADQTGAGTTKLVYNPDRKSMWLLQPSVNRVAEVSVQLNNSIEVIEVESTSVGENKYGTLHPDYIPRPDMWLKTRDYYRRPRENFNGDVPVKYYWKWFSDNAPQFFLYDFYGEQLKKVTGSYSYTGVSPLNPVILSRNPNRDIDRVSLPEYQQTIFEEIEYTLSYVDDEDIISSDVEPLQLFIGFKSEEEGALRSILQLYKKEEVPFMGTYSISSNETNYITFNTLDIDGPDKRGEIKLNQDSDDVFTDRGLKVGHHIILYIKDITNKTNQYISDNNGSIFIIREIYTKSIILDFVNLESDILETESTIIENYPLTGVSTYLNFSIKVADKEIGRFFTYGQTESEDIRFKIELGNVGKLISPDDIFIFKKYDILEGGIDWSFLNKKRKEMLMMKHLIYPYIGSYKSIINAINFFGYNDLQLNEYYKDVNINSVNFSKLFKVEIPDIFDNTVEGWTENDFIKHTFPNDNYEETNLLNLTYFITDKDGNNVSNYTLDEVVIKLQGLKYWLKRNIIPLTHKILDITGVVYLNSGTQIVHKLHDVRIVKISENMTPVTFKLNEVYLLPINSGSSVYNCVLDFYSIIPGIGTEKDNAPLPYNGVSLFPPDYFNVKIRTYKTYKEWSAFDKTYSIGDKVSYYGKLYESIVDNNKTNNPRTYELTAKWISEQYYELTSIVEYENIFYTCMYATASSITPLVATYSYVNQNNEIIVDKVWSDKITYWTEINFEPVQTISEFRNGENLLPFNFTVDSNLDPFIVIDVTSDNGYGSIYRDSKNYEIRGLRDITEAQSSRESVGPFQPIIFI